MLCFNDLVLFFFLRLYYNKLFYFQFVLFALHFNNLQSCLNSVWKGVVTLHSRSNSTTIQNIIFFLNASFLSRNFGFSRSQKYSSGPLVNGSFSHPPLPTLCEAGARKDGVKEKLRPSVPLLKGQKW